MKTDYLNIIATIILILSDAFFYGYMHEIKGWFKSWLFWEWKPGKEVYVPFYRLFVQWPLDAVALYLVWMQGWKPFIGMLLAWYFLVKEGGFYLVLWQVEGLEESEQEHKDMYWLKRWYFSGAWLFKDRFTVERFLVSFLIGIAFLIISNWI